MNKIKDTILFMEASRAFERADYHFIQELESKGHDMSVFTEQLNYKLWLKDVNEDLEGANAFDERREEKME